MSVIAIRGDASLADFRATWTGERVLELLSRHNGRMRIDWAVGVGKSHNIDQVIATAIESNRYDLAIMLAPTRQVIEERAWARSPPPGIQVVNLRPRPSQQCGPNRDRQWKLFEQRGLGAVGRSQLCRTCEHGATCFWLSQYGKHLAGTRVLFAAQAHLKRDPGFIERCAEWADAQRVLAILDESQFIMASQERTIAQADLKRFLEVLDGHTPPDQQDRHLQWRYLGDLLANCSTEDLRAPGWMFPTMSPDWVQSIQHEGWMRHGEAFQFIAPTLQLLGRSPQDSRERLADGTVRFALQTDLRGDFLVYSAQTPHALTVHRLGQDYASPFGNYRFSHPGTTWLNLASRLGMRCYFARNAPQILDVFARLIVRRYQEGRRVLCIAKKRLIPICKAMLQDRLIEFGMPLARVLDPSSPPENLSDPNLVPIIGYGAIGTNRYEHFDCVYCLTGFYVTEEIVSSTLQDQRASDFRVPITLRMAGVPPRRIAEPSDPRHRIYDVAGLAQAALDHLEMGAVLQAVGRVRPFTRAREIITFQCAPHPTEDYDLEFSNLAQMRRHFGLLDRRATQGRDTACKVQALQADGLAQKEVAQELNISLRTVQRYWLPDSTPTLKARRPLKELCRPVEVRP